MPKKKEPPLSAEEQRRRFEELARQVGASDKASASNLKRALGRVHLRGAKKPSKRAP